MARAAGASILGLDGGAGGVDREQLRGWAMPLLVRHAHAGDKALWQGPDSLRPLSPSGLAEAAGLVVRLRDYPVGRILSSPTVRCRQTVQPLADDRGLPVEPVQALGVAADLDQVLALLAEDRLHDAVVCTHGELIGQVLACLVASEQLLAWPKGSAWLIEGVEGRLSLGRYLPPLALTNGHGAVKAAAKEPRR
jgi:8-oxo-dGTP diphosphatase